MENLQGSTVNMANMVVMRRWVVLNDRCRGQEGIWEVMGMAKEMGDEKKCKHLFDLKIVIYR